MAGVASMTVFRRRARPVHPLILAEEYADEMADRDAAGLPNVSARDWLDAPRPAPRPDIVEIAQALAADPSVTAFGIELADGRRWGRLSRRNR